MIQNEEQNQKGSNSSSGGGSRSSKKQKEKKIPQRGLGVAQLEKIRLEEQEKKNVTGSSSCFIVPHESSSSIPFPPNSPSDFSLFRPPPLIPFSDLDLFGPSPPPSTVIPSIPYGHSCGGSSSVSGQNYFYGFWNSDEFNYYREVPKLDPGMAIGMQRKHNSHQLPLSLMNASSSISSSSGLNLQIEPPSNQSCYSNYTSLWPEEEKVVGVKRQWPFSLDNPNSSLPYKYPPFVPPLCRSNEAASCSNGGTLNYESGNLSFRDLPSSSTSDHADYRVGSRELNPKKAIRDRKDIGDFLSLGPPASISSSKSKQPSIFPAYNYGEFPEFEFLSFQGRMEDPVPHLPFHSFFPAKEQNGLSTSMNERREEAGDIIDLNLRL